MSVIGRAVNGETQRRLRLIKKKKKNIEKKPKLPFFFTYSSFLFLRLLLRLIFFPISGISIPGRWHSKK